MDFKGIFSRPNGLKAFYFINHGFHWQHFDNVPSGQQNKQVKDWGCFSVTDNLRIPV